MRKEFENLLINVVVVIIVVIIIADTISCSLFVEVCLQRLVPAQEELGGPTWP